MLFHLCPDADWDAGAATYVPPRYADDGFIHLSAHHQVTKPANRLFAGRTDLYLLVIDEALVSAELRWEPSSLPADDGEEFPHLYGPLNVDAVVDRIAYRPGRDGRFEPPPGFDDGE